MLYQRTINNEIKIEGIGLHSGRAAHMVLCSAPADTGVVFVVDGVRIKASRENVADTAYATSLSKDGVTVRTVEHILSALAGMGVDNVYVELDGPEVPIMDGSAWPFVRAISESGLRVQGAGRRFIKVVKPVTVHLGDKSASLLPSPSFRITYRIDFKHPLLTDQSLSLDVDAASFETELARARTFGFVRDVEMLRKAGLARGASLENAVAIDDGHILNKEGLRYKDEFVRHKMLDAVGDLSLAGMPVIGHLVADKSGHHLNSLLVRELLARKDAWIMVEGAPAFDESSKGFALSEAM